MHVSCFESFAVLLSSFGAGLLSCLSGLPVFSVPSCGHVLCLSGGEPLRLVCQRNLLAFLSFTQKSAGTRRLILHTQQLRV